MAFSPHGHETFRFSLSRQNIMNLNTFFITTKISVGCTKLRVFGGEGVRITDRGGSILPCLPHPRELRKVAPCPKALGSARGHTVPFTVLRSHSRGRGSSPRPSERGPCRVGKRFNFLVRLRRVSRTNHVISLDNGASSTTQAAEAPLGRCSRSQLDG